jgi:uncharacterized protein (TIGR02594 family)
MIILPHMETAQSLIGLKEVPGDKDNRSIVEWAQLIGDPVTSQYKHDSVPWCGLFVAHCLTHNGIEPVKDPLWALNWVKFGTKVKPGFGAIMSFQRPSGGHVGFYISEDKTTYHILGGNQSDMVNVARIEKTRFKGASFPTEIMHLFVEGPIIKKFAGPLSINEA